MPSPLHILVIPSWYPKDTKDVNGSFFREQSLAVKKMGCRVGVISLTMFSWKDCKNVFSKPFIFDKSDDDGMPTIRSFGMYWVPVFKRLKERFFQRYGYALYDEYVRSFGAPDVIHAHSLHRGGLLAKSISDRYQIPYVITEHSTAFARGLITPYQKSLMTAAASGAVRRFAVSQPFCDLLTEFFGPQVGSWVEMPNIVNAQFLLRPLAVSQEKSVFKFVSVAFLHEKKGFDTLIHAFERAFRDEPQVVLEIGGDGPQRRMLENLVDELNLSGRVRLLGMLSRAAVVETIAGADAFVLGSSYETFGVVVIEALALGKPVVATRCGGPESIIGDGDGILVEKGCVSALAEGMKHLYQNRHTYQPEAIRTRCAQRYSEEAVARRLIAVYGDVVTKGGRIYE